MPRKMRCVTQVRCVPSTRRLVGAPMAAPPCHQPCTALRVTSPTLSRWICHHSTPPRQSHNTAACGMVAVAGTAVAAAVPNGTITQGLCAGYQHPHTHRQGTVGYCSAPGNHDSLIVRVITWMSASWRMRALTGSCMLRALVPPLRIGVAGPISMLGSGEAAIVGTRA